MGGSTVVAVAVLLVVVVVVVVAWVVDVSDGVVRGNVGGGDEVLDVDVDCGAVTGTTVVVCTARGTVSFVAGTVVGVVVVVLAGMVVVAGVVVVVVLG